MNFFNQLTSGGELPVEAAAAKAAATQSLGRFNCYADSLLLRRDGTIRRRRPGADEVPSRESVVCVANWPSVLRLPGRNNRRSAILGGSHHSDKYGN